MGGIESGEAAVAQGMDLAVDLDGARGGVEPAQQPPVVELPFRM